MSSQKPYISVVVPTYNRADFIVDAIKSVMGQKTKDKYEIIVIDDGSTDDTKQVLRPYIRKIRYYKIEHSGLPAVARNYGISKAKGELIAFQDSDDIWLADKLALQTPLFKDPSVVMTYGQAEIIDEGGKQATKKIVAGDRLASGEKFKTLLKSNVISTLTVMARKSVILDVGGFDESQDLQAVEDYELWLRIAAKFPKGIKSINKTLSLYRVHERNISGSGALLGIERLRKVQSRLWGKNLLSPQQLRAMENQIFDTEASWTRLMNRQHAAPRISVIMSVYNAGSFLFASIKSVLDQTISDFEFIIINDGSTDSSSAIILSFNDPRIRLVHQTNKGLVSALNKGLYIARSEFVARQDADDISQPSRFEKELAWLAEDEKRGLVGCFFTYIDEAASTPTGTTIVTPTKHVDLTQMLSYVNPFAHGSVMYRKSAVIEAGGYKDNYGPTEDYDLWRRIALNWRVGQIPEVLYWYRISPKSISQTNQKIQHKYSAEIRKEIWSRPVPVKSNRSTLKNARHYKYLNSPMAEEVYAKYLNHQVEISKQFLLHGRLLSGYRTVFASLLLRPSAIKYLWRAVLLGPIKYLKRLSDR